MKKILLLFIAVLAFSCSSDDSGANNNPQTTDPETTNPEDPGTENPEDPCNDYIGDIKLKSQQEVDAFAAHNYCIIFGNLIIGDIENGHSDITDLSGLSGLKKVSNMLAIYFNNDLITLHGLENLKTVGSLNIFDNLQLETLEHLTSLTSASPYGDATSSIHIGFNIKLKSLKGLENLENVQEIDIGANDIITNLQGLQGLKKVKKMTIAGNSALKTFEGLNSITDIEELSVRQNFKLVSLQSLENLETLSFFECNQNELLTSLPAMPNVTQMESLYIIRSNITSLQWLDNVTKITYVEISESP